MPAHICAGPGGRTTWYPSTLLHRPVAIPGFTPPPQIMSVSKALASFPLICTVISLGSWPRSMRTARESRNLPACPRNEPLLSRDSLDAVKASVEHFCGWSFLGCRGDVGEQHSEKGRGDFDCPNTSDLAECFLGV